ncbi:hypothetical protein N7448_011020, partial [Penicillium atrosanguineum]
KLNILPFRRNILLTIAYSYSLAPYLLSLISACFDGTQRGLPTLDWQLIVLRTATVLKIKYEYNVNLLVTKKIDNIDCPSDSVHRSGQGLWIDRDRVLLRLDSVKILGADVEVLIMIGVYGLLARLIKGLRVDDDPEVPDLKKKDQKGHHCYELG